MFRGGYRVFGPRPRNYSFKLNAKLKSLARASAFSYKASENSIIVLEDFSFDSPKTKNFLSLINNLQLSDSKNLLILPENDKNVYLSARNLENQKVLSVSEVNTYQVLKHKKVLFLESSLNKLKLS